VAVVLLVSAAAAPWAGRLATRWGARRSLLLGIALLGGLLMLAPAVPQAAAASLLPLPGLLLGLLATSQTSVALACLPAGAGLGAGLVAGGAGAAAALGIWFRRIPAGGTPAGGGSSALVVAIASLVALGVTLLLPISPPEGHRAGRRNR
jgi:MFS family permease